jgi:hypothetical protein
LTVTGGITATIGTGTDNSVVVKNATNQLVTDEIDSRVWGSSLVDGSGVATYVTYWSDANTVTGEAAFTYNATTNLLTVDNISGFTAAGSIDMNSFDITNIQTLQAAEKNFDIPHPTKEGWRLRYSVLEGPERGVYVRGKVEGEGVITLPDYWIGLVYEDSITVDLTPIGKACTHYVISANSTQINVGCECGNVNAYYVVFAERKAAEPVWVEYQVVQ